MAKNYVITIKYMPIPIHNIYKNFGSIENEIYSEVNNYTWHANALDMGFNTSRNRVIIPLGAHIQGVVIEEVQQS